MTSLPEEPGTPAPRRSRLRRALVVLLAVLGVLEVVYVGAGLSLVKSGQVERWINKNPEKLRITFDSVWPIVPGVVRVRGFRIVNQGRGDQLEGKVDRVWGAVNPFELLARRVHVVWLRCRGVEFRLRRRPKTAEEAASLPAGFPLIDGRAVGAVHGPAAGAAEGEEESGDDDRLHPLPARRRARRLARREAHPGGRHRRRKRHGLRRGADRHSLRRRPVRQHPIRERGRGDVHRRADARPRGAGSLRPEGDQGLRDPLSHQGPRRPRCPACPPGPDT